MAIADLIKTGEAGGKVIGLEGGWGAGKTTVVNIIEKQLRENANITIFTFDAWAHQGDPLRRTYLESFIRHLIHDKKAWIDPKRWSGKLEVLAKRRRVERSRTVPETTGLGLWTVIAAMLVPIGALLTSKIWPDSMRIDPRLVIDWPRLWGLMFSISLAAAPVLVVIARWFQLNIRKFRTRKQGMSVEQSGDWAFLKGSIETKINEVTESPDPTSIEFEDCFRELMQEALSLEENRAVLVLDNLDRTNRKDALEIWSTLQTFLRIRSDSSENWFRKLSIIVEGVPTVVEG